MKFYVLLFFTITIFSCFSQGKLLNYEFVTYGSNLSYFTVWNTTDTSIIAGSYKIENDTVYFEEILDTIIRGLGMHGVNTTLNLESTSLIVKPNSIALTFHYLNKYDPIMYMPHVNYQFWGDSAYSSKCSSSLELDTVHYIPYVPGDFDSLTLGDNEYTHYFYGRFLPTKRRQIKKLEEMVRAADFILLNFIVYFSVKNFEFDLTQITENYVFIRGVKYPIIFNE